MEEYLSEGDEIVADYLDDDEDPDEDFAARPPLEAREGGNSIDSLLARVLALELAPVLA